MPKIKLTKQRLKRIETCLCNIDPEVDHETFHEIMCLVYIESYGSLDGLELLSEWYCQSSQYPGDDVLDSMWFALDADENRHFGMARLSFLADNIPKAPPADRPTHTPVWMKSRLH